MSSLPVPEYFDARDQPVKVPLPTPEDVARARTACFQERGDYIRHYAKLGGLHGLQAIHDIYGEEGIAVLMEYDRMCDRMGPATMSRLLEVFLRGAR